MKHKYASTLNRHQLLIVVDTSIPPYEPICLLVQLSQTTSPGSVLKEKMREIRRKYDNSDTSKLGLSSITYQWSLKREKNTKNVIQLLGKMPCFLDSAIFKRLRNSTKMSAMSNPIFVEVSLLLYRQYLPVSVHTPSSSEGALLVILLCKLSV